MLTNDDLRTPFDPRCEYRASSATHREGVNDFLMGVQEYTSSLNAGQMCCLHWYGHFPKFIQFRLADDRERACSISDGEWLPMYATYLELGLRFPLPDFLLKF